MPDLGSLGLKFKNDIIIFETNTLEFVTNEFLTHTVNFDIGSAFPKIPKSVFSEHPVCFLKYVRYTA